MDRKGSSVDATARGESTFGWLGHVPCLWSPPWVVEVGVGVVVVVLVEDPVLVLWLSQLAVGGLGGVVLRGPYTDVEGVDN